MAKMIAYSLILGSLLSGPKALPRVAVRVFPEVVLRNDLNRFFGINLNYIRDEDSNRLGSTDQKLRRPLRGALRDLKVKWLRYPGGEKSDFHRWSLPPYEAPNSTSVSAYSQIPGKRLDFDAMMSHARSIGAEPYIVVGYDKIQRSGIDEETYLADAVAWVKYANIIKKYKVRYWEIGNENWHNGTSTPEEMARKVAKFSRAMKAVDPTIKIGSSGNSFDWWSKFLPIASPYLDFLSVSQYNGWEWKSYTKFASDELPDLSQGPREAAESIKRFAPPADQDRLRVVVAETNTKDYSNGGWPDRNDLGHALVTFTALGQIANTLRTESAMIWTTRWIKDSEAYDSMFYSLDDQNQLTATGQALHLWTANVEQQLVRSDSDSNVVVAFATHNPKKKLTKVFLVNRTALPQQVHLEIGGKASMSWTLIDRLSGASPEQQKPPRILKPQQEPPSSSIFLPPFSVSVYRRSSQL